MNYSVSKNRDGTFWSLIFRDRRNRDEKFSSLFPSLFSIRDGIPSLFSVSILQFSCSDRIERLEKGEYSFPYINSVKIE